MGSKFITCDMGYPLKSWKRSDHKNGIMKFEIRIRNLHREENICGIKGRGVRFSSDFKKRKIVLVNQVNVNYIYIYIYVTYETFTNLNLDNEIE